MFIESPFNSFHTNVPFGFLMLSNVLEMEMEKLLLKVIIQYLPIFQKSLFASINFTRKTL